jgi:hypothetical protein
VPTRPSVTMIQVIHRVSTRAIRIILPLTLEMNSAFATIAFAQSSVNYLSDIGSREEEFSDLLGIRFLRSLQKCFAAIREIPSRMIFGTVSPDSPQGGCV